MNEKMAWGVQIRRGELRVVKVRVNVSRVEVLLAEVRSMSTAVGSPAVPDATMRIVGVPCTDVLTRQWEFPPASPVDLSALVAHRVEAELPVPIAQLTWHYSAAARSKESSVRVQAIRTERLVQYLHTLTLAGLTANAIGSETEGLTALYRHGVEHDPDGNDVLILAELREWLIVVFQDHHVISLRRFGTDQLPTEQLIQECRHFIETQSTGGTNRSILWCGVEQCYSLIEKLGDALGQAPMPLKLKVSIDSALRENFAEFAPAVGMALAGLFENETSLWLQRKVISPPAIHSQRWQWITRHLNRWAAAAVFTLLLATWLHVTFLKSETQKMETLLADVKQKQVSAPSLDAKLQTMQRMDKYRLNVLGILVDVCRALPDSVLISSVQLSREHKFIVKGTCRDPKAIFTFTETLRKSNRLANVNPESIDSSQGNFVLSADLLGVTKFNTLNFQRGSEWR